MRSPVRHRTFNQGVCTGVVAALVFAGAIHVSIEHYEAARAEEAQEQFREEAAEFRQHAEEFQKLTEALQQEERQVGPNSRQP